MALETARLALRHLTAADSAFVFALVTDPDWLRFIGDRGVRSVEDARGYLESGPMKLYERLGFGLYRVALKDGPPLGMCGLIKRSSLEDVDIGFAFLPEFRGQGYAREAAEAVRDYAFEVLGLERIVAITAPENHASARLLERLGFAYEKTIPGPSAGELSRLYALNA